MEGECWVDSRVARHRSKRGGRVSVAREKGPRRVEDRAAGIASAGAPAAARGQPV
jgi:hypothetical protein